MFIWAVGNLFIVLDVLFSKHGYKCFLTVTLMPACIPTKFMAGCINHRASLIFVNSIYMTTSMNIP